MADMTTIKGRIAETIYPNGTGAITAESHQALLLDIVDDINAKKQDAEKGKGLVSDAERMAWNNKAGKTGRYPEMSVGFADDLVGRGESVPAEFSFRASGGKSIKDGAARIKRLKGNSVVWNQWAKSFEYVEEKPYQTEMVYGKNNSVTITNWTSYNPVRWNIKLSEANGHKFLALFDYENTDSTQLFFVEFGGESSIDVRVGHVAMFKTINVNFDSLYKDFFSIFLADSRDNTITISNLRLIDLTLMFGAGNEPTTIEEYYARKPIVEDEYAYNEGEVIHMTAEGIKSVGDNAWDEEWNYNGSYVEGVNSVRVLPNAEYYVSCPDYVVISVYDKNDTLLATHERKNNAFTTPTNASYLRLRLSSSYGTTYNNDIMITLVHSGWKQDTDAGYQPYWEDKLMFDERIKEHFPDGMKKWDAVYNKNGKGYIVKGTGEVDMGELDWGTGFGGVITANLMESIKMPTTYNEDTVLSSLFAVSPEGLTVIFGGADYPYNGYIGVVGYSDVDSFKEIVSGTPLYYQLAEPTIIEYDEPFNLDYRVADFGTEQMLTEQPSAPIAADIIYQFNAVDMIRELWLKVQELEARLNG